MLPERKRPAHHSPVKLGNLSVIVLVTVCTHRRRPLLHRDAIHALLRETWIGDPAWQVGRYVLLPDHLHLFCRPGGMEAPSLSRWVGKWKAAVTRNWPFREELPLWQPSFWDRQMRRGENYSGRWEYVRSNPVRHGLVKDPDDWPWQGELNVLEWHDV